MEENTSLIIEIKQPNNRLKWVIFLIFLIFFILGGMIIYNVKGKIPLYLYLFIISVSLFFFSIFKLIHDIREI